MQVINFIMRIKLRINMKNEKNTKNSEHLHVPRTLNMILILKMLFLKIEVRERIY